METEEKYVSISGEMMEIVIFLYAFFSFSAGCLIILRKIFHISIEQLSLRRTHTPRHSAPFNEAMVGDDDNDDGDITKVHS